MPVSVQVFPESATARASGMTSAQDSSLRCSSIVKLEDYKYVRRYNAVLDVTQISDKQSGKIRIRHRLHRAIISMSKMCLINLIWNQSSQLNFYTHSKWSSNNKAVYFFFSTITEYRCAINCYFTSFYTRLRTNIDWFFPFFRWSRPGPCNITCTCAVFSFETLSKFRLDCHTGDQATLAYKEGNVIFQIFGASKFRWQAVTERSV